MATPGEDAGERMGGEPAKLPGQRQEEANVVNCFAAFAGITPRDKCRSSRALRRDLRKRIVERIRATKRSPAARMRSPTI
jgi:hypothetical protein